MYRKCKEYEESGRYEEAIECYKKFLEEYPHEDGKEKKPS